MEQDIKVLLSQKLREMELRFKKLRYRVEENDFERISLEIQLLSMDSNHLLEFLMQEVTKNVDVSVGSVSG